MISVKQINLYLILLCLNTLAFAEVTGTLRGVVRDRQTQDAIPGATVLIDANQKLAVNAVTTGTPIEKKQLGGKADLDGRFNITDIPAGTHTVLIRAIGYTEVLRTDIQISYGRSTFLSIVLEPKSLEADEMTVTANPFQQAQEISGSAQRLSQEEIRRQPGAREDVSRALQIIPGVQMTTDDRNDLVVRGGSPTEVLFRIDGIEFPNPNHFGTEGATGGPVGMLNNDFIQDVNFLTGGFPPRFGDKVSGVVDITYREGAPKFTGTAYLGFAGAGFTAEGPLKGERGNYIIAYRKSYLDLIMGMMNYGATPHYQDAQAKVNWNFDTRNRIELLAVAGFSDIHFKPDLDAKNQFNSFDLTSGNQSGVVGLVYTHLFPKLGFTKFIASHDRAFYFTTGDSLQSINDPIPVYHRMFYNHSQENETDLRNEWNLKLGESSEINFGIQYKPIDFTFYFYQYDPYSFDNLPPEPDTVILHLTDNSAKSNKSSGYTMLTQHIGTFWTVNIGGRYDYFDYTRKSDWSPRFSTSYNLSGRSKLTASYGWFTQSPPLVLINGNPANRSLKNMKAEHIVIGFEHLFNAQTRFSIEGYHKKYSRVPAMIDRYRWMTLQSTGNDYGGLYSPYILESVGSGRSYGAELMLQKKLAQGFYGIVSLSLSRTVYTAADGVERNSNFDSPLIANLVGGWKPNEENDISFKWTYAGGAPYTPLDLVSSARLNYPVYDTTHINSVRRNDYHKLDVRYDYRKHYSGWNLVSWFSIENIYNRRNFNLELWNKKTRSSNDLNQTGLFPVGGFTFEW